MAKKSNKSINEADDKSAIDKNKEALQEAEKDISEDPDLNEESDENDDLDEGELARVDNSND
jgi:hypothetical protein